MKCNGCKKEFTVIGNIKDYLIICPYCNHGHTNVINKKEFGFDK